MSVKFISRCFCVFRLGVVEVEDTFCTVNIKEPLYIYIIENTCLKIMIWFEIRNRNKNLFGNYFKNENRSL